MHTNDNKFNSNQDFNFTSQSKSTDTFEQADENMHEISGKNRDLPPLDFPPHQTERNWLTLAQKMLVITITKKSRE